MDSINLTLPACVLGFDLALYITQLFIHGGLYGVQLSHVLRKWRWLLWCGLSVAVDVTLFVVLCVKRRSRRLDEPQDEIWSRLVILGALGWRVVTESLYLVFRILRRLGNWRLIPGAACTLGITMLLGSFIFTIVEMHAEKYFLVIGYAIHRFSICGAMNFLLCTTHKGVKRTCILYQGDPDVKRKVLVSAAVWLTVLLTFGIGFCAIPSPIDEELTRVFLLYAIAILIQIPVLCRQMFKLCNGTPAPPPPLISPSRTSLGSGDTLYRMNGASDSTIWGIRFPEGNEGDAAHEMDRTAHDVEDRV